MKWFYQSNKYGCHDSEVYEDRWIHNNKAISDDDDDDDDSSESMSK